MRQKNADFGAERSGHYYFKNFFYAESGILAAIEVINAVSRLPYKLADFIDLLPQYYRSGEISVGCQVSSVKIQSLFKKIERKYSRDIPRESASTTKKSASIRFYKISHLDGLTMEFKNWWFNIHHSNTESLLRLNIEAKSKKILQREKKKLVKVLKSI